MADYKNLNVAGNVLVSNDVTISGNLSVLGTTTTIEWFLKHLDYH